MRTIRGVRSVARSLAECNNGWIASSSVQTRKVALCLASTAGSMISSCATPIAATRGPSPFTSRRSFVPLSKTNIRHCSSHASSSLVKMATDRDILSDEYVPSHSPYHPSKTIAKQIFPVSSLPATTSPSSTSSHTHHGPTKVV